MEIGENKPSPIFIMLRKTPLKVKKIYSLKKTALKQTKKPLVKKVILKKTELNKQNEKNKEKWLNVREAVLKRDNNKCRICGKLATQVHHIHLRSKRKDLIYNINNLVSLCDKHHFHKGSEKYFEQTKIIADSMNITVEELLRFAEEEDYNG